MRRALNVLQACHAAYDITDEEQVYNCTGSPHPSDIKTIVDSMLGDEFTSSFQSEKIPSLSYGAIRYLGPVITALKTERGLALQDLLVGAYDYVEGLELKPHARIYLLDHMATTE